MPQESQLEYEFRLQDEVGALAIDYELESHQAFDRTLRACPWLRPEDEAAFYRLRPFHKDARVVLARERGYASWTHMARELEASHGLKVPTQVDPGTQREPAFLQLFRTGSTARALEAADSLPRRASSPTQLAVLAAVESGRELNLAESLLDMGFVDEGGLAYRRAMHTARADLVDLLTKRSDPPAITDADMMIAACAEGDKAEAWSWLFRSPSILSDLTPFEKAIITVWAELGMAQSLQILLDLGASPEWANSFGAFPLHYAAAESHAAIIGALLDAGAQVQPRDMRFSSTPLGWAVHSAATTHPRCLDQSLPDRTAAIRALRAAGAVVMPGYIDRAPGSILEILTAPLERQDQAS